MRKKVLGGVFALAMIAGMATPMIGAGAASAAPAGKIDICHSTRSEKNPFVFITVSQHAADAHDAHHDGDDNTSGECQ